MAKKLFEANPGHDIQPTGLASRRRDPGHIANATHGLAARKKAAHSACRARRAPEKATALAGSAKLLIDDLLESVHGRADSSKASMVREGGLEPPRP